MSYVLIRSVVDAVAGDMFPTRNPASTKMTVTVIDKKWLGHTKPHVADDEEEDENFPTL